MTASLAAGIFARDALDPTVAVVDGFGLHVRVERGHLHVTDGIGDHRRTRRYSRIERTLTRLVIIGHTGSITLEAIRWCADVGIAVVHLDSNGRILTLSVPAGRDEPRLRRAQAAAPDAPSGLAIARYLLGAKVTGQAGVLDDLLSAPAAASRLCHLAAQLDQAQSLPTCTDLESAAANTYFAAWTEQVFPRFTTADATKVPAHWQLFAVRRSPISNGKSASKAADPVNAMLNYGYAIAEAECRIALLTIGLDPGLGVIHTDRHARDSLALDLLEAVRPAVDSHVLRLLTHRHLRAADFHETPDGHCRLVAPLTHQLAEAASTWAQSIAVHAEHIAGILAAAASGKVRIGTPLTNTRRRAAQQAPTQARRERRARQQALGLPTCRDCGAQLPTPTRQLCDICWPIRRRDYATARAERGRQARSQQTADGTDPTQTTAARAKRHASLVNAKAKEAAWHQAGAAPTTSEDELRRAVIPALRDLPLSQLQRVTGLSNAACSRIRSGQTSPHPRHWDALAALVESPANRTS